MTAVILRGDARHLPLADASVDAVVTDPPYEYTFMGRSWDASGVAFDPATWQESLRVLKPGGHMLAFGGTRTYHRMACAIEDAGFEIRDSISHLYGRLVWCYGSGFPKSSAVSRDQRFCQCVPGVREAATEEAAESAAKVLLADVYGEGTPDAANLANLHGLPVNLHPDYAIPGGTQQDVLAGVRSEGQQPGEDRQNEGLQPDLPMVRGSVRAEVKHGEEPGEVLLHDVLGQGAFCRSGASGPHEADQRSRRKNTDGQAEGRAADGEEPGLEGRGDLQAPEGQLHRPEVRPVSAGSSRDGTVGRVRDGAPASDGALDRPSAEPNRVRESHRPEPQEQRAVESGAVSDQRRPQAWGGWPVCRRCSKPVVPAGLGTALKPAHEPIIVARKPLDGTVAANVLTHGTGALHIDACRIGSVERLVRPAISRQDNAVFGSGLGAGTQQEPTGRWPTNLVLTHSAADQDGSCAPDCPVAELDRQSAGKRASKPSKSGSAGTQRDAIYGGGKGMPREYTPISRDDTGGASRFFPIFRYEAKAPASERPRGEDGITHVTVKPLALMRWLVRLVTPPGGICLDPFLGSGTTAEAAVIEGFHCVGVELDEAHLPLIRARLSKPIQPTLEVS